MVLRIRPIRLEDAGAYLSLAQRLDQETAFMMLEPGERSNGVDVQRNRIEHLLSLDNQMIFVAEVEGQGLVGLLGAIGGEYRRNRETVHIFVGVLQAFAGQGIGRCLFETAETWARGWGAHRLELTVMTHNLRAIGLYHSLGFRVEGLRRDSLRVGSLYVDEYEMAKLLTGAGFAG